MRLLMVIISLLIYLPSKALNIEEAIKNKLLTATFSSNLSKTNNDSHTGKCLKLIVKNNSNKPQTITIDRAMHLQNIEKEDQSLISIEQMIVSLKQLEEKTITINALCCNKSLSSPDEGDIFNLSFIHKDNIADLAHLLEQKKCFNNTAQQALWCYTDQNEISAIYDTHNDTLLENVLVKHIAKALNRPLPVRTVYIHTPRIIKYPLEIEGKIAIHVQTPTTIGFYITDSANVVIDTIIIDELESRVGTATFSWGIRKQVPRGVYYVQQKLNGEMKRIQEIKVGSDE